MGIIGLIIVIMIILMFVVMGLEAGLFLQGIKTVFFGSETKEDKALEEMRLSEIERQNQRKYNEKLVSTIKMVNERLSDFAPNDYIKVCGNANSTVVYRVLTISPGTYEMKGTSIPWKAEMKNMPQMLAMPLLEHILDNEDKYYGWREIANGTSVELVKFKKKNLDNKWEVPFSANFLAYKSGTSGPYEINRYAIRKIDAITLTEYIKLAAEAKMHWITEEQEQQKLQNERQRISDSISSEEIDDSLERLRNMDKANIREKTDIANEDLNSKPDFDSMDGHTFERFCATLLEKNSFTKVCLTGGTGDQGIDIIAFRDEIKYGIQCKCYSTDVGNAAVQEVFSGRAYYGCHIGIVLTNRYFTRAAISLAEKNGVVLWDRDQLLRLIKNAKQ